MGANRRMTIAVDFDGVLHSYTTPWSDAATIPDPPVDGAIEWLNEAVKQFAVFILTTRADQPGANHAVREWLVRNGFTGEVTITSKKVPALVYIDDRAWRFQGPGTFPPLDAIPGDPAFKPWNKS